LGAAILRSTTLVHRRIGKARRQSFEQAAGLSMRDIAKEAGLHFTRVAQILRKE